MIRRSDSRDRRQTAASSRRPRDFARVTSIRSEGAAPTLIRAETTTIHARPLRLRVDSFG
jgi:hypothetical protein